MNTSANYEEIRQQLLQLTEAARRKLLEEVNQSIPAQAATESRSLHLRWLAGRIGKNMAVSMSRYAAMN
jgi:dihydroneopterin aldolase